MYIYICVCVCVDILFTHAYMFVNTFLESGFPTYSFKKKKISVRLKPGCSRDISKDA